MENWGEKKEGAREVVCFCCLYARSWGSSVACEYIYDDWISIPKTVFSNFVQRDTCRIFRHPAKFLFSATIFLYKIIQFTLFSCICIIYTFNSTLEIARISAELPSFFFSLSLSRPRLFSLFSFSLRSPAPFP